MADPILDDILSALDVPAKLRLALNTLEAEMPVMWGTGAVGAALRTLRAKLEELELEEIRRLCPSGIPHDQAACPGHRRRIRGESRRARAGGTR